MRYVLDSCVALKWVLPEPLSGKAQQLRDDYRRKIHQLLAPDVFPAEIAHGLTRAERRKIISTGHAIRLLADIMQDSPDLHSYIPLLTRATDISSQTRQGFYDCVYVALAEREGCEFVTVDDKMLKNLQPAFPFIVHLASLP